jgi:hypothetical protein
MPVMVSMIIVGVFSRNVLVLVRIIVLMANVLMRQIMWRLVAVHVRYVMAQEIVSWPLPELIQEILALARRVVTGRTYLIRVYVML